MIYSHSSLSLWQLCKRRWYNHYVLGKKEPSTPNMAFSTWLLHAPIEHWIGLGDHFLDWNYYWGEFLKEIGEDYATNILFNLTTARVLLERYKASPIPGNVKAIELTKVYEISPSIQYTSRADFLVESSEGKLCTVDLKFVTSNWSNPRRPWPLKPLLAFDDQLLGQAITYGADAFIRVAFQGDRKSGNVVGPIIEERLIDGKLKEEWLGETISHCLEIESWLKKTGASWPKNDASCDAFGRPCSWKKDCANAIV